MGDPAARKGDSHSCPITSPSPHIGGRIVVGSSDVLTVGEPAARVKDPCLCTGPLDAIGAGSLGVLINGLCAARMGDSCLHGGNVTSGVTSVVIGHGNNPMAQIANGINPSGSVINCGFSIYSAVARLYGTNPNATSPAGNDGSFPQIGARHGTNIVWGQTLDDAFSQVRQGGHGTTAIVGIDYGNGSSHTVPMTNWHGTPVILEGQNWGAGQPAGAITDPTVAQGRYNPADTGVGMLPNRAP